MSLIECQSAACLRSLWVGEQHVHEFMKEQCSFTPWQVKRKKSENSIHSQACCRTRKMRHRTRGRGKAELFTLKSVQSHLGKLIYWRLSSQINFSEWWGSDLERFHTDSAVAWLKMVALTTEALFLFPDTVASSVFIYLHEWLAPSLHSWSR